MRKQCAIIVNKAVRIIGKIVGKGSSLPGQIALKIDSNILKEVKLPKYTIAVTGSNGKTSTVEMIEKVLSQAGLKVSYNKEGSNQIEGITTLILDNCNLKGEVQADVLLMETDERYARHTFKHFSPNYYVITNLYRDQLTRNGHHEWMYDIVKESIKEDSTLLLNADDPLISLFGEDRDKVIYYGINENKESLKTNNSVYDDGKYCPKCKGLMKYSYYHFNHIGSYECPQCGYKKKECKYNITSVDLEKGELVIENKNKINLALKSMYNVYNILATYSLCKEMGISEDIIINTLNNYIIENGRVKQFMIGNHKGSFLASKHENSISYDQSLKVITNYKDDVTVLIIVDAISRKYFTSETSWLWDIDFELLQSTNVKKICVTGLYSADVAERLEYSGIDMNNVYINSDIEETIQYLENNTIGHIFAITCFSDQNKLLSRVEVLK